MSADPEDTLVLETSQGTVIIAMRPDLAPGPSSADAGKSR